MRPSAARKFRKGRSFLSLLVCLLALAIGLPASAADWFSGRTIDGQTRPLSASWLHPEKDVEDVARMVQRMGTLRDGDPAVENGINLTVVLEQNPEGDDRLIWVQMMEHFADAIFEATNGAHRLRNIRIYRDNQNRRSAAIYWRDGTDLAHVPNGGGRAGSNLLRGNRINMFFPGAMDYANDSGVADWGAPYVPVNAGYIMAHEMGHYWYGLYDEYRICIAPNDGNVGSNRCPEDLTDNTVDPSIMYVPQWAFGIAFPDTDYGYLNFSVANASGTDDQAGPFEIRENTEQFRKLQASAWDVLSRPHSADPADCNWRGCSQRRFQRSQPRTGIWLGPRVHYPELASFAPTFGDPPPILMGEFGTIQDRMQYFLGADGFPLQPIPDNDPRSLLRVIWMGSGIDLVISIDKSGSMSSTMMAQAREAAKGLVDQLEVGSGRVAITAFNESVSTVFDLAELDSEATRDQIKQAIDGISAGGWTAIGDAARDGLNKLLATGDSDRRQVVFLMTDGINNRGENPVNVIPDYQNAQIPLFTFGFGSNADEALMRLMAAETGGEYFFAPTTLAELALAFEQAGGLAASRASIASGITGVVGGRQSASEISFVVDDSISSLNVSTFYQGTPAQTEMVLRDPNGVEALPEDTVVGSETRRLFRLNEPVVGEWTLEVTSLVPDLQVQYNISGAVQGGTFDLGVATETRRDELVLGQPVILEARVAGEDSITGLNVEAWAESPSGNRIPLHFRDDGTEPDGLADDGLYTAQFVPGEPGAYRVIVKADNSDLQAQYTSVGGFFQSIPGQEPFFGELIGPVGENFDRQAILNLEAVAAPDDADGDGVPDWVEDAVANPDDNGFGDGNGDGIPDRDQAHVVSVPVFGEDPTEADAAYATLETADGLRIVGMQLLPPPEDGPPNVDFPFGGFRFSVEGLSPGDAATLGVFLPNDYPIDGFWKQGTNGEWTDLADQVTNVGNRQRVQFTLTDGQAFDDDGMTNAIIFNAAAYPGSSRQAPAIPVPLFNAWTVLILTLMLLLVSAVKFKQRQSG